MKIQVINPGVSAAIGYVLVVALIALFAWLWFGVFGFSPMQLVADMLLMIGGALLGVAIGPSPIKRRG